MDIEYINVTPHGVNRYDDAGNVVLSLAPSGTIARLTEHTQSAPDGHAATVVVKLGECIGLSDPQPGVVYVASMPLVMGLRAADINRPDVVYPYGQVRDSNGRIIGCRDFATIA